MYIHGYASNGNATKARLLKSMFPESNVITPTFDYNADYPDDIQSELRRMVEENDVRLIVGSSFGGYQALCTTLFFEGPVWCVNPVRDVVATMRMLLKEKGLTEEFFNARSGRRSPVVDKGVATRRMQSAEEALAVYEDFDQRVFQHLPRRPRQLNFALSFDDDVLGSHEPLLAMFPNTNKVVWRDNANHHFTPFLELKDAIADTLKSSE